jgi:hypothetical protein
MQFISFNNFKFFTIFPVFLLFHIIYSLTLHSALHTHTRARARTHAHTNKDWINMQPLDRTDSVNDVF